MSITGPFFSLLFPSILRHGNLRAFFVPDCAWSLLVIKDPVIATDTSDVGGHASGAGRGERGQGDAKVSKASMRVCGPLSRPPPATLQTPTPTPLPGGHGLPNTRPTDAALSNDPYITNPFHTRTPSRLAANGRQRGPEVFKLCFGPNGYMSWAILPIHDPRAADKPRS